MAINFIKKEDLSHITRTTRQWETTIDRYEIIPKGVLCIELCNDKLTKIKIGNGHLIYEQLPYVSDVNLSDYYTKEETNTLLKHLKSIKIKGEASSLSDLPLRGNEEGDLWFVAKPDPDEHNRYDEYVWYKNKWELFGSSDIDLSEYAKKSYVDTHIQEVQDEITEIIESGYLHKHSNKDILDQTSAVYTVEKDNKLRDLHNYDDTELREKAHTHLNKNILDQTDAVYNRDKDDKLASLHNYDDTDVKDRISTLEGVAHSHSNQDVLDRTTAAFTREQAMILLDCKDFVGTDGVHNGYHGFVPAPTASDAGKVLGANGQWVEGGGGGGGDTITQGGGISITTDAQTGVKTVSVNAGTGLDIDQQTGELYVTSTGGDTIAEGSGIDITTDSQTGVKTISVDIGNGLQFNQNSEIELNTGQGLSINQSGEIEINTGDGLSVNQDNEIEVSLGNGLSINNNNAVELDKATTTTIGGVIVGDNLSIDNTGTLSADEYTPGEGISIDSNKEVSVKYNSDGLSINASDELELDKATKNSIGGVIVGDNIDVSNGTISVPEATDSSLGVVKPTDGLSIDNTGELSVNTGDGLSINQDNELEVNVGNGLFIDSTNNDVNVKIGRGLSINNDNEIDANLASNDTFGIVKIGDGIDIDQYGIISVDKMAPFRPGIALELVDESGRLPDGYVRVEYVSNEQEGAWTQINYVPNANTRVVSRMSISSRSWSGSGAPYNTEYAMYGIYYPWDDANRNEYDFSFKPSYAQGSTTPILPIRVGFIFAHHTWDSAGETAGGRNTTLQPDQIFTVETSLADGLKIDNNVIHTVTQNVPLNKSIKIGIFTKTSGNGSSGGQTYTRGKIYTFKIYENDELKVNLIPCIQLTGNNVGFYDSINGIFYPSIAYSPFETDTSTIDVDPSDWVMNLLPATSTTIGGVKEGQGVTIDPDGTINVTGGSGDTVEAGDGIDIDTDSQTGNKVISVVTGNGLEINNDNEVEVNIGDGLTLDANEKITIDEDIVPLTHYFPGTAIAFDQQYSAEVDIWNNGTGWANGAYTSSTGNGYLAGFNPEYHSPIGNNSLEVPTNANRIRVIALSTNDDVLSVTVHCLDASYNRYLTLYDDTQPYDNWLDLDVSARYVNFGIRWTLNSNVNISATDIKSVTLYWQHSGSGDLDVDFMNINVNYGDGLTVNQDNELVINIDAGDGIDITTDSQTGNKAISVITQENGGLTIDEDTNGLKLSPSAAGKAINISDEITFDSWNNGTGWANEEYYDNTSDRHIPWGQNLMIYPTSTDVLFRIPDGVTQAKCSVTSVSPSISLKTGLYFYNAQGAHFAGPTRSTDPDTIIDIPAGSVYVNQSIRKVNDTNVFSDNVAGATITWLTGGTKIDVKYGTGLALNQNNELEVNIGDGLSIDPDTGAINVTGGGGGDSIAEGDGISINTDQQTGDKVIAVNAGTGLQVNQTTNELEVSSGVVTSIAPTQNTPGSITVTEGDGTTTPVSVISQMGGATSSTAGTAGYVPAPASGDDDAYLRGDGTWDDSVVTDDDELTLVFVPDDYQPS